MAKVFIGTSGYTYDHWRGVFYPQDLRQKDWLSYYTEHFDTVEINASFYHQMSRKVYEGWREKTPKDFIFAVKGSRFITHIKRLKDCQEPVERFLGSVGGLGEKLGPVLWQLPPRWKANTERLEEFLGLFVVVGSSANKSLDDGSCRSSAPRVSHTPNKAGAPAWGAPTRVTRRPSHSVDPKPYPLNPKPLSFRHAFEFRDPSWLNPQVYEILKRHNAALVIQDSPSWKAEEVITAGFTYLRFHGRESLYSSCYSDQELEVWVGKIKKWQRGNLDVFAYFNNDALGYAVSNALKLKELVGK